MKLVVDEAESAAMRVQLADDRLISSALAWTEVGRAVPPGLRTEARRVLAGVGSVDVTADVLRAAASVPPSALRSLDAIHLATALSLGSAVVAVVCYDRRLADAAEAHGLRVEAPA